MEIGPFSIVDVAAIVLFLESKNVAHEMIVEEPQGKREAVPQAENICIEMSDEDYQRLEPELIKLGIVVEVSDGSWELGEDE
jgi:hypothetical protein